jgi:hypothetical protein
VLDAQRLAQAIKLVLARGLAGLEAKQLIGELDSVVGE